MEVVDGAATVDDLDAFLDELATIGDETNCAVQAFDARYVVDREQLQRAVELADRSFERGENVARDRAVEILLYAAGRRQIDRALEIGVNEGTGPVVVVVHGEDGDETAGAERVGDLLDSAVDASESRADPDRIRSFFDVSDAELEAAAGTLADLVHERVALLDVEK